MCLVEGQQVGKTRENHLTDVEPDRASVTRLTVDDVVTYFAALSLHTNMRTDYSHYYYYHLLLLLPLLLVLHPFIGLFSRTTWVSRHRNVNHSGFYCSKR